MKKNLVTKITALFMAAILITLAIWQPDILSSNRGSQKPGQATEEAEKQNQEAADPEQKASDEKDIDQKSEDSGKKVNDLIPLIDTPEGKADENGNIVLPLSDYEEPEKKKDSVDEGVHRVDPEDYSGSGGYMTEPFDVKYPEEFASGDYKYSDETLLIKFKPGFDGALSDVIRDTGVVKLEYQFEVETGCWYLGHVEEGAEMTAVMAAVRALENVVIAEYNFEMEITGTQDSLIEVDAVDSHVNGNQKCGEQWVLKTCGIDAAWKYQDENDLAVAGDGTLVAVIDTGVDYDHIDLAANIYVNKGEIPNNGIDDDGNGYVDDYYGWDAIKENGSADDDNGHGTHVAGIIAAVNNKEGVVGIAYNAKILPIKAGNASGIFSQSDIVKAINYARKMGADVINMSFGGSAVSSAVEEALKLAYTSSVLVAAAGNNGLPNEYYKGNILDVLPCYPAAYPFVLGVMAVDESGKEASFTNYDGIGYTSTEYELYAPGTSIISTIPGDRYATWSGTSMAAPVVSAMAAMVRADYSDLASYPTKFVYGQLTSTSETYARCLSILIHKTHNLPKIANVFNALTELPKPELGVQDYTLFDTKGFAEKNNGDGAIDAGETIALGFTLSNRWGMSKDTTVTISAYSQADIPNPYVTFSSTLDGEYGTSATVNYGSVGTYSTKDAGKVYTDELWTGWETPIYVKVAPDCPNDMIITLTINVEAKNGLDETDSTIYETKAGMNLTVRRGVIISGSISEDQTWTKDNYYIIANSTLIQEGVTVTVEPGTQIQFWTADKKDAYYDSSIVYLKVAGTLKMIGTEEEHISLFPSELFAKYRVQMYRTSTGTIDLKYCDVTNPCFDGNGVSSMNHCFLTYSYSGRDLSYRYISSGTIYCVHSTWNPIICNTPITNTVFSQMSFSDSRIGSADGCVFVDCGIDFDTNSSTRFTNCVFYGNNTSWNKQDSTYTNTKTIFSGSASYEVYALTYNKELNTTYAYCSFSGAKDPSSLLLVNRLLLQFGGSLVCIETEEEDSVVFDFWNQIVRDVQPLGNDTWYYGQLGLYSDGTEFFWVNGNSAKDYASRHNITPSKTGYYQYNYTGNGVSYNVGTGYTAYALLEFPGEKYIDDIGLALGGILLDTEETWQITAYPTPYEGDLIFESEDEAIATVDKTGLVTPVSVGATNIRVISSDRAVYSDFRVIVKEAVALHGLTISASETTIKKGETLALSVAYDPVDTTKRKVFYSSSDQAIATVDAAGLVTAVGPGTADITVMDSTGEITDTVSIRVIVPAEGLSLSEKDIVVVGLEEKYEITPTFTPFDTTERTLYWDSSNPEVAYVDSEGKLIKLKTGLVTIRGTVDGTEIYSEVTFSVQDRETAVSIVKMQEFGKYLYALTSDGTVWMWGDDVSYPKQVSIGMESKIVDFAVWSDYFHVLDENGDVFYRDITYSKEVFSRILRGVKKLSVAGKDFYGCCVLALKQDGTVWGWGGNGSGQVGIGSTSSHIYPSNSILQIDLENIVDIYTSYQNSYFLSADGNLYCAGRRTSSIPKLIYTGVGGFLENKYINGRNDEYCCFFQGDRVLRYSCSGSYDDSSFTPINSTQVASDDDYAYIENGKVYVKGSNSYGELGVVSGTISSYTLLPGVDNAVAVYLGGNTTFVETADGKIFACGYNNYGQLCDGTNTSSSVLKEVIFGLEGNGTFSLEKTNLSSGNILTGNELILDFSDAVQRGSALNSTVIKDSTGSVISTKKEFYLDKFTVRSISALKQGETYTLTLPAGAVMNKLGTQNSSQTFTFTVAPSSLKLSSESASVEKGHTLQLTCTTTPANIIPTLTYSSSNPAKATVDENGLVTALSAGKVTITVTDATGTVSDSIDLDIVVPVQAVSIGGEGIIVADMTSNTVFTPGYTPADTTETKIVWESSNPEVAYVDAAGKLVKVKAGMTTIRATVEGTDVYDEVTVSLSGRHIVKLYSVENTEQETLEEEDHYLMAALFDDGSLGYWRQDALKRITFETKYVDMLYDGQNTYLKDGDGKLHKYEDLKALISDGTITELDADAEAPANESLLESCAAAGATPLTVGNNSVYISDGIVYVSGTNDFGELGVEEASFWVSEDQALPGVTNAIAAFITGETIFVETENGLLYAIGRNDHGQLGDETTTDSHTLKLVDFGYAGNGSLLKEATNLTEEGVLEKASLVLDFSDALVPGETFENITLKDSEETAVAVTVTIRMDKLTVTPNVELIAGESYQLLIPAGALKTKPGSENEAITVDFSTPEEEPEEEGFVMPVFAVPVTIRDESVERFAWTKENMEEALKPLKYYNYYFYHNAVLNRLETEEVTKWFRVTAAESSDYQEIGLGYNYWGTTNEVLINKQILDFDDFQSLADFNITNYLTEAPEDVWPFVVDAGVKVNGEKTKIVGNQEVTFYVEFNRDMDTEMELRVCFGSAYPYADYQVPGEWVNARTWEGTTTLQTIIENGAQCLNISNARTKADPEDGSHLKFYTDWGRFTFGIDTSTAQSLIMQANATETGIHLEWYQDDFDTLAGYNIYRRTTENGQPVKLNKTILLPEEKEYDDGDVEPGKVYYYSFTVVKTDGTESDSSGKVTVRAFDSMAPGIYHTPINSAFEGTKIMVSATVTDNVAVHSVSLFYRITGTTDYTEVAMVGENDQYLAAISMNMVTLDGVDYYIRAFDGINYTYKGTAENPYSITVKDEVKPNEKGDVDGDGVIGVKDALMILQAVNGTIELSDDGQFDRADLNGDGQLMPYEAMYVLYYVNGKITSLENVP